MSGAIVNLSVNPSSKINGTLTLSQVMPTLMAELMMEIRRSDPSGPAYPSLLMLAEYGFLPFYSSYTPYVDVAFEYQVSRGQAQNGGNYQFTIPLFGDFFSDMVLNVVIDPIHASHALFPNHEVLHDVQFPNNHLSQVHSHKIHLPDGREMNTIDHERGFFHEVQYSYQDVHNRIIPDPTGLSFADLVKYVDFPGERMMKWIDITINSSVLDAYDHNAYVAYRAHRLTSDKKIAYERAMGQEQSRRGTTFNVSQDTRQQTEFLDGPQTPKFVQPQLQMWIKLLFWFSQDFKQAIPSAAIPMGQRFINVQTHHVHHELIQRVGSIYRVAKILTYQVAPDSPPITHNSNGSFNLSDVNWINGGAPISQMEVPVPIRTHGQLQGGHIQACDMYINHLFSVNEIHKIITNRISYYLVRLHRIQRNTINKHHDEVQLTELKYPIEYMNVWASPERNRDRENPFYGSDWWKGSHVIRTGVNKQVGVEKQGTQLADIGGYFIKEDLRDVLERVSITVQQTPLYHDHHWGFYSNYLPLQWPGVISSADSGQGIIPFKLYDLYDTQPAGAVNASRIRDFYLKYKAHDIGHNHCAELIIVAMALNFLLISDGTATIRYLA